MKPRSRPPARLVPLPRSARPAARRRGLVAAVALAALAACGRDDGREHWEEDGGAVAETWTPGEVESVLGVPKATLVSRITARVDSGARPAFADEVDWRRARTLYAVYADAPLWLEADGVGGRVQALVNAIEHAHTDALRTSVYPIAELRRVLEGLRDTDRPTPEQLVEADVLLTTTYVALAGDMLSGQVGPQSVSQAWHVGGGEWDADSAIAHTIRLDPLDRGIARMRPQDDDFDALRRELARFRALVANGGWGTVPAGETLEPGDTSTAARLDSLLARLAVEGFVEGGTRVEPLRDTTGATTDRALYTGAVAGAVAQYQARHGIGVDSILGAETVASLNTPAEYRLRQIAANLERYRWMPRTLGQRYVFVNVPAFHLTAFEGGEPALEMKVIVGAEYDDQATPAFSDSMSYLVFRPYWNVPEKLALEEVLPAAWRSPGYMARNGYEVVRYNAPENGPSLGQYVPGAGAISGRSVRIRQRPGPENSLGDVKFMFPNDFNIYLHDTPADALFERDVRAFSHGCIRLEKPAELAQWVLGWDAERVREAMTSGPPSRRVNLERKIPVYILYLTTYVRDGVLHFGNDLYDRDASLTKEMADAAMAPDEAALAEIRALEALVGG